MSSKQEQVLEPNQQQQEQNPSLKEIEKDMELSRGEQQQSSTPTVVQAPEPNIFSEVKDIVIKVSQEHINQIVKDLKDDFLRLEYVDSKGKMQVDRRQYSPMTIAMNKKAVKVGKKIRQLNADIKGMGESGGMDVAAIQLKYPDILEEDVDEYDLTNEAALGEIIANYIVAEKAKIYWGINDIDNYSLHDLMIVQSLYESRNNFAPSLQNTPTQDKGNK